MRINKEIEKKAYEKGASNMFYHLTEKSCISAREGGDLLVGKNQIHDSANLFHQIRNTISVFCKSRKIFFPSI